MSPRQFTKLAPVIVATAALSTLTLYVVAAQDHPELSAATEYPRLAESILPSVVPTGAQLAADATDGNTNAHDANTTPKSNTLFFEIIVFTGGPSVCSQGQLFHTIKYAAARRSQPGSLPCGRKLSLQFRTWASSARTTTVPATMSCTPLRRPSNNTGDEAGEDRQDAQTEPDNADAAAGERRRADRAWSSQ